MLAKVINLSATTVMLHDANKSRVPHTHMLRRQPVAAVIRCTLAPYFLRIEPAVYVQGQQLLINYSQKHSELLIAVMFG